MEKENILPQKKLQKYICRQKNLAKTFFWRINSCHKSFFAKKSPGNFFWKNFHQINFSTFFFVRYKYFSKIFSLKKNFSKRILCKETFCRKILFAEKNFALVWVSSHIQLSWEEIQLTQNLGSWNLACQFNSQKQENPRGLGLGWNRH